MPPPTGPAERAAPGVRLLPQIDRSARHVARRGVGILGAAVGAALSLPLFLILAAAVKVTSPGPVLFRQLARRLTPLACEPVGQGKQCQGRVGDTGPPEDR